MMKVGLLTVLRTVAPAKILSAIAVLAILMSASPAWAISGPGINSLPADCDSWCQIKQAADFGTKLTGYFSKVSTAVDVAKAVLTAFGAIDKDPGLGEVIDLIRLGFDDNAWREIEIDLGRSVGAAETVISNIRRRGVTSTDDDDSNGAVRALINTDAERAVFSFPYNTKQSEGMAWLGYSKADLDQQGPNSFYDWRLGIPALLRVIAYRVVVLGKFHPNFLNDGYGRRDLDDYRAALINHYNMMLRGVRCHYLPWTAPVADRGGIGLHDFYYRCADIHTGLSTSTLLKDYALNPFGNGENPWKKIPKDLCHSDSAWNLFWEDAASTAVETICATSIEADEDVLADLRREVISSMPLYEVKAMIDLLYLLTHPMRDSTAQYQRLPSYVTPSLCLEAKGESNGAGLQLWTCDSDPLQHWVYYRASGHIYNPDIGKCLEISYGAHASGQNFPVSISECFGRDEWQSWTYDPEKHVLLSAMGPVLTIEPRDFFDYARWFFTDSTKWFGPGDPVWSGPPEKPEDTASPPHQWLVHDFLPID